MLFIVGSSISHKYHSRNTILYEYIDIVVTDTLIGTLSRHTYGYFDYILMTVVGLTCLMLLSLPIAGLMSTVCELNYLNIASWQQFGVGTFRMKMK